MTTLDTTPSLFQFLTMRLAARASKKRAKEQGITRTLVQDISRLILHIAGFACLTVAGFSFSFSAGMIVAGVSCFAMSTLSTTGKASTETTAPPRMR